MISKIQLLVLVNLLYMVPSVYLFMQRSNMEFIAYLGIVILIGMILVFTYEKIGLSILDMWALSFFGFAHMMGGLVIFPDGLNLYKQILIDIVDNGGGYVILKMDQVIHCLGYGTVAFVIYSVLNKKLQTSKGMLLFLSILVATGLGALNEVIEFIVVLSTEFNGVGDLYNMGFDLIFNFAGAITGALIQYFRLK